MKILIALTAYDIFAIIGIIVTAMTGFGIIAAIVGTFIRCLGLSDGDVYIMSDCEESRHRDTPDSASEVQP
jgi:hypothetical protein